MSIGGSPNVLPALGAGEVQPGMRGAANDQARHNSCECKVKALWHLQYGGLNSNSSSQMQALISRGDSKRIRKSRLIRLNQSPFMGCFEIELGCA
ncbi:MAG: hypothetical protein DME87_02335 [Verrucomicrobia bacterium]|nr:MAG: hypothetical protein DME87_02335 [Verrucomicrobiota bacterium]